MFITGFIVLLSALLTFVPLDAEAAVLTVTEMGDGQFAIHAKDIEDAAAIDISLTYDPKILANPKVESGPFTAKAMKSLNLGEAGVARIIFISAESFNGSGLAATVTFKRKSGSSVGLLDMKTEIYSSTNTPVPAASTVEQPKLPDSSVSVGVAPPQPSPSEPLATQLPVPLPSPAPEPAKTVEAPVVQQPERMEKDANALREEEQRARMAAEAAKKERLEGEKRQSELLAREKAEKERLQAEKLQQERQAAEKAEQERLAVLRAEQERTAQEKSEAAIISAERVDQEKTALSSLDKAKQEQLAREKDEAARAERERKEKERAAAEKIAMEKIAAQKAAAEKKPAVSPVADKSLLPPSPAAATLPDLPKSGVLAITADNKNRPRGSPNPKFTFSIIGYEHIDPQTVLKGSPVFATKATVKSPPGDYPIYIRPGSLSAPGYELKLYNGILTIYGSTVLSSTPLVHSSKGKDSVVELPTVAQPPKRRIIASTVASLRGFGSPREKLRQNLGSKDVDLLAKQVNEHFTQGRGVTQTPPALLTDGKSEVTVRVELVTAKRSPGFAMSGGQIDTVTRLDPYTWEVVALPEKGADRVVLTVLGGGLMSDLELVAVKPLDPKAVGRIGGLGKKTVAKALEKGIDVNGDGKHDYTDDYRILVNYIVKNKPKDRVKTQ